MGEAGLSTPMPSPMTAVVQGYLDHLVVERGVSAHTVAAFTAGICAAMPTTWPARGVTEAGRVTAIMVSEYAMRLREGVRQADGTGWAERPLSPASVARAVVAVRSLHRFALAEGLTAGDPAEAVQPPQPPRRLPKALSLDQVQAMLDVPATDTELGLRDAALLELLYGTGLRISEAVALDVDEVDRIARVEPGQPAPGLRVLGKGNKERIVPMGSYAQGGHRRVPGPRSPRPGPARSRHARAVPERPGQPVLPAERLVDVAGRGRAGRYHRRRVAAHAAALLRHAPAGPRRRRPRRAGLLGHASVPRPRSTPWSLSITCARST